MTKLYYEVSYIRNEVPQVVIVVAWDELDALRWFKDYKSNIHNVDVQKISMERFNMGMYKGVSILEVPGGWGVRERLAEFETELEEIETELEEATARKGFTIKGTKFHGHEISPYGKQNGYVDYRTLAKCFNNVLNNDIFTIGLEMGDGWEFMDGSNYNEVSYILDELDSRADSLVYDLGEFENVVEDNSIYYEEWQSLYSRADDLSEEIQDHLNECNTYDVAGDVYQWYIVDGWGAELLQDAGELVIYNNELDIILWGVGHWGTSWDYVLTNIKIEGGDES